MTGRVIDDLGAPVEAVNITVASLDAASPERSLTLRSAADGSFVVSISAPGRYEFTAQRSELLAARTEVTVPTDDECIILVLPRPAILEGIVINQSGLPLADATVSIALATSSCAVDPLLLPSASVSCGSDGSFVLSIMPGTVALHASHSEHADSPPLVFSVGAGEALDGIRIVLSSGGRIIGRVDASCGAVGNRRIVLYGLGRVGGFRDVRSSAEGTFAFEDVLPQDYVVELQQSAASVREMPFHGSQTPVKVEYSRGVNRIRLTVQRGETTEVTFERTSREISLHGLVTSYGGPLQGVMVRAVPSGAQADICKEVATGADGRFELAVADAGPYKFFLSRDVGSFVWMHRSIPDVDVYDMQFDLPSGSLAGDVRDAQGRAVPGVPLTLVRKSLAGAESYGDEYRIGHSASDGTFCFALLPPGEYTLRAPDGFQDDIPTPRWPHGSALIDGIVVGTSDAQARVPVSLPLECHITGVVVGPGGSPAVDASTYLTDKNDVRVHATFEQRADGTGRFKFSSIAPGVYSVHVTRRGVESTSLPVFVDAGSTANVRLDVR